MFIFPSKHPYDLPKMECVFSGQAVPGNWLFWNLLCGYKELAVNTVIYSRYNSLLFQFYPLSNEGLTAQILTIFFYLQQYIFY